MTWPPTPRADGRPCKNCGRQITDGEYPVHAEGDYRGKNRCSPGDSGQPYGLEAEVAP